MKSRSESEPAHAEESREDIRELAEALSLFGSAMRHAAARQPHRPWAAPRSPARALRARLVLAPALAAMLAAAALIPLSMHRHGGTPAHLPPAAQESTTVTRAGVNDTVLMNQIDSDVSEEVPDALQPLADLSEQAAVATTTSPSERKNVTQE